MVVAILRSSFLRLLIIFDAGYLSDEPASHPGPEETFGLSVQL